MIQLKFKGDKIMYKYDYETVSCGIGGRGQLGTGYIQEIDLIFEKEV